VRVLEYTIKIKVPAWLDYLAVTPVLLYRWIRYGYTFRRIPLSRGKFAIVDPDDYPELKKYKWFATKNGATFYAKRHTRLTERIKTTSVCMHRLIMNAPDNLVIDHINYNGLDNRKANLRLATRRQNSLHIIRTMNPGSSKYKGISWREDRKKWAVRIMTDGKTINLGCYKDEVEAARAYDKAARKLHGQFASLNFPKHPTEPRP